MGLSNNDTYVAVTGQIADGIISLAKLDATALAALKPGWTFVSATTLAADASKDVTLSSNEHHMVILNVSLSSAGATLKLTPENATGAAVQYLTYDSGAISRVNAAAAFFNVGKVLAIGDKVSGQITFNRTPDTSTYAYYSGTCNSDNGTTSMYAFLGGEVALSGASTKITLAPTAGTMTGQVLLFKAATS